MNSLKIGLVLTLIVAFSLGVYCFFLYKENQKLADRAPVSAIERTVQREIVKKFTDSLKQNHTTFRNGAPTTIEELKKSVNRPLLDTVARALDIKNNQVIYWQQQAFTSRAGELMATKSRDSLQRIVYRYNNKYIDISYTPNVKDSTSPNGIFSYKYNAKINTVQYTKRRKVLGLPIGSKESFTDIYTDDPNATINGLRAFSVKQKEPSYGLRLQAATTYNLGSGKLSPGLGAQFDFRRFSVRGVHYFNSSSLPDISKSGLKQNSVLTLSYDLLKF